MGYTEFKNLPSKDTPLSAEKLNEMQKGLMELVFPIGSTYITQSDTNPKDILRFGTWERFKGLIALGLDENDSSFNEIGKKGGEKEHTLSVNEMPSHSHEVAISGTRIKKATSGMMAGGDFWNMAVGLNGNQDFDIVASGNSQPHNNLQPYEVTGYMWIRRA